MASRTAGLLLRGLDSLLTNHFLSISRETAAKFPDRLLELLGYGTYNGAIGTIGTPGTHRYANSAFRDPATVLGR